jgi:hypothetical protein
MTAHFGNITDKYQGVAPRSVIQAVSKASAKTGVDFTFLMEKAATESSFNPAAKAKTSSAAGLFQFIENTWLSMVKNHGEKYGLGEYAEKITIDKNGKACVKDCDVRKEILGLRKNAEISALMAGEFSSENKEYLEKTVGGDIGATELYMAHFLGANGAAKFLNAMHDNPNMKASALLPEAARANKKVFYDQDTKHALSVKDIYAFFDKKFNSGTTPPLSTASTPSTRTAIRSATAPVTVPPYLDPLETTAQALPSSSGGYRIADIIWNDEQRFFPKTEDSRVASSATGFSKLSAQSILTILEMQQAPAYNS